MPNSASASRGRWGEDRAAGHYRASGFHVLARNWRSGVRGLPGELDLVVARDDLIVFCEVKARRTAGFGGAAGAVDCHQQARIRALAAAWLRSNWMGVVDVRFDVIAIEGVRLTHHPAAF